MHPPKIQEIRHVQKELHMKRVLFCKIVYFTPCVREYRFFVGGPLKENKDGNNNREWFAWDILTLTGWGRLEEADHLT